jgi:hypothetical protein
MQMRSDQEWYGEVRSHLSRAKWLLAAAYSQQIQHPDLRADAQRKITKALVSLRKGQVITSEPWLAYHLTSPEALPTLISEVKLKIPTYPPLTLDTRSWASAKTMSTHCQPITVHPFSGYFRFPENPIPIWHLGATFILAELEDVAHKNPTNLELKFYVTAYTSDVAGRLPLHSFGEEVFRWEVEHPGDLSGAHMPTIPSRYLEIIRYLEHFDPDRDFHESWLYLFYAVLFERLEAQFPSEIQALPHPVKFLLDETEVARYAPLQET